MARPSQTSVLLAAGLFLAGCTSAGPGATTSAGPMRVESAWARRAPATAPGGHGPAAAANGAVYLTVRNTGAAPDAIVEARTDAAHRVELHETRSEGGVMRMHPRSRFDVPAGATLEMKPGGHHVMLLGLTRDLAPGDSVTLTVTFEKAGPVTVTAPVR
jgi:copper(I)-binding protein